MLTFSLDCVCVCASSWVCAAAASPEDLMTVSVDLIEDAVVPVAASANVLVLADRRMHLLSSMMPALRCEGQKESTPSCMSDTSSEPSQGMPIPAEHVKSDGCLHAAMMRFHHEIYPEIHPEAD